MPVHARAQVAVSQDSLLPRDAITVNPCFRHNSPAPDWQSLANNIATYFQTVTSGTQTVTVKLYDIEGAKPVYPMATAVNGTSYTLSDVCRELAICLSYYHNVNRKRQRGRLYIPLAWLSSRAVGVRPSAGQMAEVLAIGDGLSGIGGADVDWGVWSTVDHAFHQSTNVWVDDEWDIIRSRGLRGSTRQLDTVTG